MNKMKKKIAVLFSENVYIQRGLFNAVRNRVKYLAEIADYDIDAYVISTYESWPIRVFRKTKKVKRIKCLELDGVRYHVLWHSFSIIDYLFSVKLHWKPLFRDLFLKKIENKIIGYDAVSAHSVDCGKIAFHISQRDRIPFFITWHGSEIHTAPFRSPSVYKETSILLKSATCNFFVSKSLLEKGKEICAEMKYTVLYNGVGSIFHKYDDIERKLLRQQFKLNDGERVIAYAGHLIEVKNPHLLPLIFEAVFRKYGEAGLKFWIIGSGKDEEYVINECRNKKLPLVFWGAQEFDRMPQFMNCIDVFVLPSRNEGLPLVTVEAISCGANVVGSDVGGIKEVIGEDNVFKHGDLFIEEISDRIIYMLTHDVEQTVKDIFHWDKTAERENSIYRAALDLA